MRCALTRLLVLGVLAGPGCGRTVIETVALDVCDGWSCRQGQPEVRVDPGEAKDDPDAPVSDPGGTPEDRGGDDTPVIPHDPEKCNGIDDDGDGQTDEPGAAGCKDLFIDADKDEFGAHESSCQCAPKPPYSALLGGDCDDANPGVHPGAAETCYNLTDDDCDGEIRQANCGGRECGPDGCGSSCGSCSAGLSCNGYGQCVAASVACYSSCHCPAGSLCAAGNVCKPYGEVAPPYPYPPCCSDATTCLPAGIDCRHTDGSLSACAAGGQCAAKTCQGQGATCGNLPDGCGGILSCGSCAASQNCGGEVPNVCGLSSCISFSCEGLGADCGLVSDGCGGVLYCGTCDPGVPCGGGGADNSCGGAPSCGEDEEALDMENTEKYYYSFDPGQSRYFYFSEKSTKGKGNSNPLQVDVVDMTPEAQSNVDVVVKYVGFSCEFAKPTIKDHEAAVKGEIAQGENGLFFGVSSSAFEIVEIPDNPEGFYYVLVLNVGSGAEKKMRIGYTDEDSY